MSSWIWICIEVHTAILENRGTHVHVFIIQVRALVHEKIVNICQKYNTFLPPDFIEICHVFEISSKPKNKANYNIMKI